MTNWFFFSTGNTYVISGKPKEGHTSGHFLETPFFPQFFQSDYIAEYILQSDDPSGHVMLMFLDFQLAPQSFIEVSFELFLNMFWKCSLTFVCASI